MKVIRKIFHPALLVAAFACVASASVACADAGRPALHVEAAEHVPAANVAMMLAASLAGKRIVAVGDRGVVLLSDDDGKTFRQARSVPVSSSLTGVSFADARTGWAVGHWGAIVKTTDGGETWTVQRSDLTVDQPLFSVYFKNTHEGWTVGLWSLMLHTTDGGATWSTVKLPPPLGAKKADRNLYSIFADAKGSLFIACEQGRVLRSSDGGVTWTYAETGYSGSFWSGVALQDGTLLVGGLRGTIYRSADGGSTWTAARTPFKSSVTGMVQRFDKSIVASALDGVTFVSHDDGATFTGTQRPDRTAPTAVVDTQEGVPVFFTSDGPVVR